MKEADYNKVARTECVLWAHIRTLGEMDLYPFLNGRELWALKLNNYFDPVT